MTAIFQFRIVKRCFVGALLSALSAAGNAQTAADTARLAASSGYLETGGLKIGMPLAQIEPAARALNARLKVTNTTDVTVWPYDPANPSQVAPPDAPVSTQILTLATMRERTPQVNEDVTLNLAIYPNKPVVTTITRTLFYPPGTGPNFEQVLKAITGKLGQATENNLMANSATMRMQQLRWYFDSNGKLLPPGTPRSVPCGIPMSACPDLSMVTLDISAAAGGVVTSMDYKIGSGPLMRSAEQATDTYLQSVSDARLRNQTTDSQKRTLPKL